MTKANSVKKNERFQTYVKGFDTLLGGGLIKSSTYLLLGPPGSGKTILANQLSFNHLARGGRVLYVTLLAESHNRMFGNLEPMSFFKPNLISDSIQYMSGYSILEKEGLDGLMNSLNHQIRKYRATLVFIDGVASADELAGTSLQFKKFVHNLNSVIGMSECTTVLLSSAEGSRSHPEHTMVDGIIALNLQRAGMKIVRKIEVRKLRGSMHLQGNHSFTITNSGLTIYPRTEEVFGFTKPLKTKLNERLLFGISGLDEMLGGGLISGSVTALLGPPGSGKTSLGASFLAEGVLRKEKGLLFSLYEHPNQLVPKLASLGIQLGKSFKDENLYSLWRSSDQYLIDRMMDQILEVVLKNKIKRVFIDGFDGMLEMAISKERILPVMTALSHELKSQGVTTLITEELDLFLRTQRPAILSNHSAVVDNIIELQHVNLEWKRCLSVSVLKARDSQHDQTRREMKFSKSGIVVLDSVHFTDMDLPLALRAENTSPVKKRKK